LTQQQVAKRLEQFLAACHDFERELPAVWRHLLDCRADGFPASTLGGGRGADVSNPTLNAALRPDPASRDLDWVSEFAAYTVAATRELDRIRREYRRYVEPPLPCDNPWCPDRAVRAEGRKRCDACAKHKQRQGSERGAPQQTAS
jgi:hypothetical protein